LDETLLDRCLHFGRPQGFVLEPKNYNIYTKLVGEIRKWYNSRYQCYVDDIEVYMILKPNDKCNDISFSVETSIADTSI